MKIHGSIPLETLLRSSENWEAPGRAAGPMITRGSVGSSPPMSAMFQWMYRDEPEQTHKGFGRYRMIYIYL